MNFATKEDSRRSRATATSLRDRWIPARFPIRVVRHAADSSPSFSRNDADESPAIDVQTSAVWKMSILNAGHEEFPPADKTLIY
jgi:hypothetical protein